MKTLLYLFLGLSILTYSQTTIPPGDVSGNWLKSGNPYLITGDITIQNGNTLTIQPGVMLEFQGNYKLNVYGRLLAIGAINDTILFTAADTSIGWHGIRILNSNSNSMDSSKFILCKFTAGKALTSSTADKRGGAIYCEQSSDVLIQKCVFMNNYAALDGGAIAFINNSAAFVDSCLFMYNSCYFYGGCIYIDGSNTKIKNTVFANNYTTFFGAAITGWNSSAFVLENCKILNNEAGAVCGIYTATNCSPKIINTLFSGNNCTLGNGGAAGFSVSTPTIINCTFVNNTAAQLGAGVWIFNSTATIKNSVFWNNNPDQINLNGSTATVTYSNVMGGFTGTGNINLDPAFVLSGNDPYSILDTSPCRNTGTPDTSGLFLPSFDLAGNLRISENRIDMGAYEYQGIIPVELTSFNASVTGSTVTLNWITATEQNNLGFDVERKNDSESWMKIGFVDGNGTSTKINKYIYVDSKISTGTYNYRIKQIDFNGTFKYYNLNESIEIGIPNVYNLSQNYPNPFNPSTLINFSIPKAGVVTMKVFNVLGKEVATLVNENKDAGNYIVELNASNFGMRSGVYFYTLESGGFKSTKKMLIIK